MKAGKRHGLLPGPKVITEIKNYITQPRTGMLVSLISRRAAYSSIEEEMRGTSSPLRIINPGDIVLFLGNIKDTKSVQFSYDQVLYKEKVVYILNDYPRTEQWIEVK